MCFMKNKTKVSDIAVAYKKTYMLDRKIYDLLKLHSDQV